MPIQQTIVGLEKAFERRAVVLSRTISEDDTLEENESSWLQVRAPFPIQYIRIYNRARNERRIPNELIEATIDNNLNEILPNNVEIIRNVAIGAMYTDDLPVSNPAYANQYIVVSLEGKIDLDRPLMPRDAEVSVEMYFGLLSNRNSTFWRIADPWYHHVSVSNVGPVRRKRVRDRISSLLTSDIDGISPGDRIRDGLRNVFNRDDIVNWYVIPGDGALNSDDNDISVRHDASFYYVE